MFGTGIRKRTTNYWYLLKVNIENRNVKNLDLNGSAQFGNKIEILKHLYEWPLRSTFLVCVYLGTSERARRVDIRLRQRACVT